MTSKVSRKIDADLLAIQDIRNGLSRLKSWGAQIRVLLFVLREVWPNAYFAVTDDADRRRQS